MSAATMKRLVRLAYARQEKLRSEQRNANSLSAKKNQHLARGKTLTDVRVVTDGATSPEQKVAQRLSVANQDTNESLHIRSYSLPKERGSSPLSAAMESPIQSEVFQENTNTHSSHPTITITSPEEVQSQTPAPSTAINNMLAPTKSNSQPRIGNLTINHAASSSDTQTLNSMISVGSELSESAYTVTATEGTEFTADNYAGYQAKGKTGLMSINSQSSSIDSSYMSSKQRQPNILPPALETVPEPSTDFADEVFGGQAQTAKKEKKEIEMQNQKNNQSRMSVDLQETIEVEYNKQSIWSSLCCCCDQTTNEYDSSPFAMNETINEEKKDLNAFENNDSSAVGLDNDDWRTYQSGASRMRRPTAYTTATNNEDSTIHVDDVKMWSEPFGKGASARVFKGVYLPLCQVMALKVTSRLDNDNVKQILGEFRQQCDVLPECDELMRIHGWYRNMKKNEIAVALEYMDLGSVFDSCFNSSSSQANSLNISQEEQDKSGHRRIVVGKLSYDQIRFIARQTLLGLHSLHTNKPILIHRDIKPQNILLSSYGAVKVADFGLLIELENGVCSDSKGTSKYFSPERIQGSFNTLADIWSVGITLIEIYKQELISAEELDWFKIVEDGIDIDDLLPPTTPSEFMDFLKLCLAHNSEDRPSAKTLLNHQFITRKWGNPLKQNSQLRHVHVEFCKENGNQQLLDTVLGWLEEWILSDEESNAKLFLDGDSQFLTQCVTNLSKYSGLPPKYIDRYIADLYREYTQFD